MPPEFQVGKYEFDMSKLTIADAIRIMYCQYAATSEEHHKCFLALLEILDRVTVGGIQRLPADEASTVLEDFREFITHEIEQRQRAAKEDSV